MELLRIMMLHMIVLLFFATVLDVLLPSGSFRSYIKMAMGLFAVATMLQPVMQFFQPEYWSSIQQETVQASRMMLAAPQKENVQYVATDNTDLYRAQIEEQYAAQTARQAASLLMLTNHTAAVSCRFVSADDTDRERQMMIYIQLQHGTEQDMARIQQAVSGYFGLPAAQVQVCLTNEEEIEP